jgi:chromate transporter
MQEEVVARRAWVPAASFDRGLAFAMMLPGPEAQQLATWLGWRLHGLGGGLLAGAAFVLPGAALMIVLAWVAAAHGQVPLVAAVFAGVQPVVIALVVAAMWKIAARALAGPLAWALAVAAFLALAVLGVPFPLVVALAALAGLLLPAEDGAPVPASPGGPPVWRHAALTLAALMLLLACVFLLNRAAFGPAPHDGVAWLFTTAAFVTFGGAYAVLPFVAEQAVALGWLSPAEMLNGLAIAEATPGPLILVNTYAGFFAGWSHAGSFGAGAHAAALATFYTFAPSTALMLAFAPGVERLHAIPAVRRMLAGVSAAVVGVIANLAVFLAEASFLPEGIAAPAWPKIALFAVALPLVFRFRLGMLPLVGFGVAAGLALHMAGML